MRILGEGVRKMIRQEVRRLLREGSSVEMGIDKGKKVLVDTLYGMKSTPKTKKFKDMAEYEKWADSEDAENYTVIRVYNESSRASESSPLTESRLRSLILHEVRTLREGHGDPLGDQRDEGVTPFELQEAAINFALACMAFDEASEEAEHGLEKAKKRALVSLKNLITDYASYRASSMGDANLNRGMEEAEIFETILKRSYKEAVREIVAAFGNEWDASACLGELRDVMEGAFGYDVKSEPDRSWLRR